jgi:hypothetical protein
MRTLRRHDQKDPSEGSQLPRASVIALSVSAGRCDDQGRPRRDPRHLPSKPTNKSFSDLRDLMRSHDVNPLRAFCEECRAKFQALNYR